MFLNRTDPFTQSKEITPHDTNALPIATVKALYVGGAGTLKVRMRASQTDTTFSAVAAGSLLPIEVDRVYATGTSATGIVGFA